MGEKMQVTPSELSAASTVLGSSIERFNSATGAIVTAARSLQGTWTGADASEFQNAISGNWEPELKAMLNILVEFRDHLSQAAQAYSEAQSQSQQAVGRLKSL